MIELPPTVTQSLTLALTLEDGSAELDATLCYDSRDPFAVTLTIAPEAEDAVVWVFARELLAAGMTDPSGVGDVTIEPAVDENRRRVRITLAGDRVATMTVDRHAVIEFLCHSYSVVPSGTELDHVDLDAEIAALLP